MSTWREEIDAIEEPRDLVAFLGRYYHVPTFVVVVGFMLWSRVRKWENFLVDGTVFFSGNDAWYHYRMVSYTVEHWPETSPFDPWTYFPFGTHSSQFGTIFDQVIATVALVVGLGNPSDQTIRMVLLFAPAIIGTAVAIPTYYIGKRLGDRLGGLVAIGVLALAGSTFASRGTVGFSDHQIVEVLLQTVAILATMVAVSVAEEEKPIYELFVARDVAALRRPVGWAVVAGIATAVYIWSWPPGVLLFGVLGLYYLFELVSEYAHGESPEHVAIVGAISLSVTGVLTFATIEQFDISPTAFTLLQPGLAFTVAFGCLFMAWLARQWDARDLSRLQYPVGVATILVILTGAMAVLLPDLFDYFVNQVTRVVGLSASPTTESIGEASPMPVENLYDLYRFTIFVAALGAFYVVVKQFLTKPRAEFLLPVVWGVVLLFATLTQQRFDYYLVAPIAVLSGMFLGQFADFANLKATTEEIEFYQVITIVAIVLVMFAPLALQSPNGYSQTDTGVRPGTVAWSDSLDWMQDNTPEEGEFGGANSSLPYYGTYESTEDYDYPNGTYGVMSWWDYGHWITVMGERIPNANPFQLGANDAADFLISTSEDQALDVLDRVSEDEGAQTRYVMVDWKMVNTESRYVVGGQTFNLQNKYFAPFAFTNYNVSRSSYYLGGPHTYGLFYETPEGSRTQYRSFSLRQQSFYNSTAARLYLYHGSAKEVEPIVVDWEMRSIEGNQLRFSNGVQGFNSMEEARNYTDNDLTSQIGGVGPWPQERVPAMEHFRLVGVSNTSALRSSQRYQLALSKVSNGALQNRLRVAGGLNPRVVDALHETHPAWVKNFEKVPGATVAGQGPANTTVTASVEMEVPASNSTFTYTQRAKTGPDGEFTMTLPYSSTGYDEWTTAEGYTEPTVQALGPYEFSTERMMNQSLYQFRYNDTAHVTEGQVIGKNDSAVTVELTKTEPKRPEGLEEGNGTSNSTSGADDTTDGTDGSDSSDSNGTSDSNSVAPPSQFGALARQSG